MKGIIENIFDNDVLLTDKENQEKQEIIKALLEQIKEEELKKWN